MFFEGSEKKIELCVKPGTPDLRSRGKGFWSDLVEKSGAKILSTLSNEYCDAHLLSESSLFVWKDQVTMITCGQTELVNAAELLVKELGAGSLETFFFERKNEYFPQYQKTDFFDDLKKLSQIVEGKAFRLGPADEHHLFLFHMDQAYQADKKDFTLEILLYGIKSGCEDLFNAQTSSISKIRDVTGIDKIFPDFEVDDFLFSPCGYSLNALRGPEYYTVHVTPQEESSYVSFETNVKSAIEIQLVAKRLVQAFEPSSMDLVAFHPNPIERSMSIEGFQKKSEVRESLSCGYDLEFLNFFKPKNEVRSAQPLELISDR